MNAKKPSSRFQALVGPGSIAIAILSVATLGVLILAGETTPAAINGATDAQTPAAMADGATAQTTRAQAKQAASRNESKTARRLQPRVTSEITDVRPAATTYSAAATPAVLPASRAAGADVVSNASAQNAEPITVVGCLERDDDTFKLKKTEGEDAPKARSWKSGFLKRSAASIEVVDVANRLRLGSHVGERVSLTGMLVDREMQARSMRRLAADCE